MKNSFLYLTTAIFCLALTNMSVAQEQKRIDLDSFNELMIGGDFNVILTEEASGSLTLKGSKEAIDEISVTLRNQKLRIEKKKRSYWMNLGKSGKRVTVEIPSTNLKGIYLSGSGNLSGSIKAADQLKLVVSGSGSIESDLGDNIEILEAENPHLVQSWGHSRAMPPKKYFKEDDDDFDLQEEQRP